ncbi:probable cytochrome P450 6a13 [Chironomus tepperi]|uniref:probable cytochrome P450 6a13 n=1 Tax=Chironomus tepperi TaxID=113505 RepID=UPI00391FA401
MNAQVLTLIAVILSIIYLWIKRRFTFWKDRGFMQGHPSFPLGTLQGVGTSVTSAENLDYYYRKFKGKAHLVGLYNFLSPSLLIIDPKLIKNILVRDFQSFHDRGFYYDKEGDPLSASILTLDGQDWRDRRVKLSPIFTSGKMKMMFEIINDISDKLVRVVSQESQKLDEIEMRSWTQRYTIDNIGNVAFGIEPNCIEVRNSEFELKSRRIIESTFFESLQFIFASEFPNLARKLGVKFLPKEVSSFFLEAFVDAIKYRENNEIERNDFVKLLLGLKDVYSIQELAAEAFLVFIGGFETSSTLMTFALYELALNPDIQERLREEITAGIEENDGKLTYDLLFGFKYLDMVIQESLRKYPPIPIQFRKATIDYHIPKTKLVIPKGTLIQISSYSVQHDPEYFPDPDKFDPERFNEENIKDVRPFTNLPFGDGPRNCLGMRFGLMQSKMGITKIIKNFIVSPSKKTPIPVKFVPPNPFLAPVGGMWLNLKKIE